MQTVKGLGILVAATILFVGCKEDGDANAPDRKPESPLKKVDDIITTVETGKPPVKTVTPPETQGGEEEEAPKIPVAVPVPDKPGFVISPYNGKWIDVTGVKAGTLMADPHFTEEKKFFRVPELPAPAEEKAEPDPAAEDAAVEESV